MVGICAEKLLDDADVWVGADQSELKWCKFVHFGLEDAAFLCLTISSLDCLNVDKVRLQLLQTELKGFILAMVGTCTNHV